MTSHNVQYLHQHHTFRQLLSSAPCQDDFGEFPVLLSASMFGTMTHIPHRKQFCSMDSSCCIAHCGLNFSSTLEGQPCCVYWREYACLVARSSCWLVIGTASIWQILNIITTFDVSSETVVSRVNLERQSVLAFFSVDLNSYTYRPIKGWPTVADRQQPVEVCPSLASTVLAEIYGQLSSQISSHKGIDGICGDTFLWISGTLIDMNFWLEIMDVITDHVLLILHICLANLQNVFWMPVYAPTVN